MRGLRAKSRDWLQDRAKQYRLYGTEYWSFVGDCQSVVTHLAIIAALSVLSDQLEMNLEMVALSTTGSDHLEPVCTHCDRPCHPTSSEPRDHSA